MRLRFLLIGLLLGAATALLAACGGAGEQPTPTQAPTPISAAEPATGSTHAEGEQGVVEDSAAEAVHEEGDGHAAEDHTAEASHEEGDAHAADEHDEDHESSAHGVPEEAAARPNPIAADEQSVARGAELYKATCAVCHGEQAYGDGPAGAGLKPPPADLHEDHVQVLSDGALFYVIQNGIEGTAMPGWDAQFSEEDIWHLVNFIRSLKE
ncbi:MAG: hypothetical protein D6775_11055 [Caldilineae bacterium]|nr:MAG: hypothetical protein D6775_11055 [Caldilineae bacterium]